MSCSANIDTADTVTLSAVVKPAKMMKIMAGHDNG